MRKLFSICAFVLIFIFCLFSVNDAYSDQVSPEWVKKLDVAKDAQQLFIVAGVDKSTAWISMHEKDASGKWIQIMTTPGFIGKNGLGKIKEGDLKTPVGIFAFDTAFGIAPDPGCAIPYLQVDENFYWSGDGRPGMMYNKMVDIRKLSSLDKDASEHIIDYNPHYIYCLNINYNKECVPGKGSAIFLHCLGDKKPFTGGCVALPEDKMKFVLKNVHPNCRVVIGSMDGIGAKF